MSMMDPHGFSIPLGKCIGSVILRALSGKCTGASPCVRPRP